MEGGTDKFEKQRMIPSRIIQEFTAVFIYMFIPSIPKVYIPLQNS